MHATTMNVVVLFSPGYICFRMISPLHLTQEDMGDDSAQFLLISLYEYTVRTEACCSTILLCAA